MPEGKKKVLSNYIYCNLHIYKVINMNKKSPELSNKKNLPPTVIAKKKKKTTIFCEKKIAIIYNQVVSLNLLKLQFLL